MPSKAYWANRANQRMDDYVLQSEQTADEIARAYYKASKQIESEMIKTIQGLSALSDNQTAIRALKNDPDAKAVKRLQKALATLPDGPEKQEALTMLASPAYQFRLRRLQETLNNAQKECERLYKAELKETTSHLKRMYNSAFSHTIYDIDRGYNTLHTFSLFPASRVNKLLKSKWSGMNYSSRIWGNTQSLADSLKEQLLVSFMTGASTSETARALQSQFETSAYAARRLVRTETNYIANQAELDSYKRLGIEEYQYIATLDTRTSELCQKLDGRVFNVDDAKPGLNLPPMHPNCRSTTIMYDAEEPIKERIARDENGKPIYVPGNMKYSEWLEKYHPELVDYARSDETFYIVPPPKGDAIKAQNIYKGLQKSEIGKSVYKYIIENNVPVEINYTSDAPEGVRGYCGANSIFVYAVNTKTVKLTVETIIHEVTHMKYNIRGSQWAEAHCFAAEALHTKNSLTISDKRDIIKKVKKLYSDLDWR
ncbi:MAG: minor capsid protein [Oscillospiraceae bacterium]|nr:minor capsid protein [Oscillospiraceae bacterium]